MTINWRKHVSLNGVGWALLATAWVFLGVGICARGCETNNKLCFAGMCISGGAVVFSVAHRKPGWGRVATYGLITAVSGVAFMH